MKTTLSIVTFALVASVFTVSPVSSEIKLQDYSTQMSELNKIEKELKQIEKEVDNEIVNKTLNYKKEMAELKKENNLLKEKAAFRYEVDTVYITDTIVIKEKKSFWGKTKTDTIK